MPQNFFASSAESVGELGESPHHRKVNLPPSSVPVFKLGIRPHDAAPNLVPTELLAMQGRYLGMPR
jgi:hypothetical protein